MTVLGTLNVTDDGTVIMTGYSFTDPLAWPADAARSHAIYALDEEIAKLISVRARLLQEIGAPATAKVVENNSVTPA